jgi:peptidoglycan/xylan/chitin deacetylase (PgdA/CDA1 family)
MKALLLTFDVEEFDLPRELGRPLSRRAELDFSERGLERILALLQRRGVRATFFVTARFAHARRRVLRDIVCGGHEIAAHGLLHRDDYGVLEPERARARLAAARGIIERAAGVSVTGVRMPRLRWCGAEAVRGAGFTYDASAHPTWVPGRYCGLTQPRRPWIEHDLARVPVSVLPGVRLPVSWLWWRWAGPRMGAAAARLATAGAPYLQIYFHAWEALPLQSVGVPVWLARGSGDAFVCGLDRFLGGVGERLQPMTVGEFVRERMLTMNVPGEDRISNGSGIRSG